MQQRLSERSVKDVSRAISIGDKLLPACNASLSTNQSMAALRLSRAIVFKATIPGRRESMRKPICQGMRATCDPDKCGDLKVKNFSEMVLGRNV